MKSDVPRNARRANIRPLPARANFSERHIPLRAEPRRTICRACDWLIPDAAQRPMRVVDVTTSFAPMWFLRSEFGVTLRLVYSLIYHSLALFKTRRMQSFGLQVVAKVEEFQMPLILCNGFRSDRKYQRYFLRDPVLKENSHASNKLTPFG